MTEATSATTLRIYWVNQYAVPPDQPGGTRHYDFATELQRRGHRVNLVASDLNLSTRTYSRRRRPSSIRPVSEHIRGVSFTWLTAGSYQGNNWRRVASMLVFGIMAFQHLLRVPKDESTVYIGSSPHLFAALGTWAAARVRRVPFVFEVRDLWPESYAEVSGKTKGPEITLMQRIADLLYRQAELIVVLAGPNAPRIVERGVDADKVINVPNGVDLDGFATASGDGALTLGEGGRFTFVYAGAHGPANDLETAVQAAALLRDRGREDIGLAFLGDGATKDELIALTKELGLENVEFHDPVPKSAVPATLRSADAGLMILAPVDLFTYGVSPNKLFDYMGAGLPVLTNVAGLVSDIVSEADVGLTVAPGDPRALADGMEALKAEPPADPAGRGQRFIKANYDRKALVTRIEERLVKLV